jgi:hypothetical protein
LTRLAPTERRELEPLLDEVLEHMAAGPFRESLASLRSRLDVELGAPDQEALALFIESLATTSRLAAEGRRVERVLGTLHGKTERGRQARDAVRQASELLEGLTGRRLEAAHVALIAPGTYVLELETEGTSVRLELAPRGVQAAVTLGGA